MEKYKIYTFLILIIKILDYFICHQYKNVYWSAPFIVKSNNIWFVFCCHLRQMFMILRIKKKKQNVEKWRHLFCFGGFCEIRSLKVKHEGWRRLNGNMSFSKDGFLLELIFQCILYSIFWRGSGYCVHLCREVVSSKSGIALLIIVVCIGMWYSCITVPSVVAEGVLQYGC